MQNQTKKILREIKLQRLIPKYKKLKIEALLAQRWESASKYRDFEKTYMDELRNINIKELKKNRTIYLLKEECEAHKRLKHVYAKDQKFEEAFEHLLLEKDLLEELDQIKKDLEI